MGLLLLGSDEVKGFQVSKTLLLVSVLKLALYRTTNTNGRYNEYNLYITAFNYTSYRQCSIWLQSS